MTLKFVVTAEHVVGLSSCRDCGDGVPYRTAIDTLQGMYDNLSRLDYRDNHYAPSILKPCVTCIGGGE